MREFTEQEAVRREKAENLRELGLDPIGQRYDREDYAIDIKNKYAEVEHDAFEKMEDTAKVAGRIMFIRKMGKASFFTINDKTGPIQVYISINDVGEDTYKLFKTADIGDIVGGETAQIDIGERVAVGEHTAHILNSANVQSALVGRNKFRALVEHLLAIGYRNVGTLRNHKAEPCIGVAVAPDGVDDCALGFGFAQIGTRNSAVEYHIGVAGGAADDGNG